MRLVRALSVLLFAGLPGLAQADGFSDPGKLVAALYAQYASDKQMPDETFIRTLQSARLNDLFDQDAQEANGEIGRIDFDPYVNGQDYQISKLKIDTPYLAGGKAIVHVTFDNSGTAQDLGFALVKEDGWKIDDVWADGDYPYDLLDILQTPLPDVGGTPGDTGT